jgi:hypothetical protein
MNKLSSTKVAKVLRDAQTSLLLLTQERDKLAADLSELQQTVECDKLARQMHSRGVHLDVTLEDLASSLRKEAQAGKLGEITRAVDMMGPNFPFASQSDVPGGLVADPLTSYLVGNVGS